MSTKKIMARSAALVSVGAIGCGAIVGTARAVPAPWKRCSLVNRVYPHGVGRIGAHDITRSSDPVTNFKRSTRLSRCTTTGVSTATTTASPAKSTKNSFQNEVAPFCSDRKRLIRRVGECVLSRRHVAKIALSELFVTGPR
jgi:hypothetical protein